MAEVYRGHEIVVIDTGLVSAIIIERQTGVKLPTKITALPHETADSCVHRARDLIDLYLETSGRRGGRRAS